MNEIWYENVNPIIVPKGFKIWGQKSTKKEMKMLEVKIDLVDGEHIIQLTHQEKFGRDFVENERYFISKNHFQIHASSDRVSTSTRLGVFYVLSSESYIKHNTTKLKDGERVRTYIEFLKEAVREYNGE